MKNIDNAKGFDQLLEQEALVIADFYAQWCPSCMALMPTLEALEAKYRDNITFVKVNVDQDKELALRYGVRSIPSLFFIRDSQVTANAVGMQGMAELEVRIDTLLHHEG